MADGIASGFPPFTDALEVVKGVDLSGRTAIVTGASSGIGLETARALAHAGAAVTLAVRDTDAGERVAADLRAVGGAASVERLDLAEFASIRAFAERWGERPLHILVNNAGVMASPLMRTVDGLEMQVGVCHFGHFLLTVLLAERLVASAEPGRSARVVTVSSLGHRFGGVDWDDPQWERRPYDKWKAYGQAKTANVLFTVGLERRLGPRHMHANALMPGGIMTPLQRHLPREEMVAFGWMDEAGNVARGFKTPAQGASTSVWAAVGPELEGVGGLYLEDLHQAPSYDPARPREGVMDYALDPGDAERLWELSVATTGADLRP